MTAAQGFRFRRGVHFTLELDADDPEGAEWAGEWVVTDARSNKGLWPSIWVQRPGGGEEQQFDTAWVLSELPHGGAPAPASTTFGGGANPWHFGGVSHPALGPPSPPNVQGIQPPALRAYLTELARQGQLRMMLGLEKKLGRGMSGIDAVFRNEGNMYWRFEIGLAPHCVFQAVFGIGEKKQSSKLTTRPPVQVDVVDAGTGLIVKATATRYILSWPTLRSWVDYVSHPDRVVRVGKDGHNKHLVLPAYRVKTTFTAVVASALWKAVTKKKLVPLALDLAVATQNLVSDAAHEAALTARVITVYALDEQQIGRHPYYLCFRRRTIESGLGSLYEVLPGVKMYGSVGWAPASVLDVLWHPHASFTKRIMEGGKEVLGDFALKVRPTMVVASSGWVATA